MIGRPRSTTLFPSTTLFRSSPARLWNGLSGLGTILRLMVPPSPGELWLDILRGLAESVAMAFLGTFVAALIAVPLGFLGDRKSTRLNSSHANISYAVFCLKK